MMSLGKKYLFLATLKGHSGPPPSPITKALTATLALTLIKTE